MKDRVSVLFLERGELVVLDGAFILKDVNGVRVQIPIGSIACLMLEPGTRVSHAEVKLVPLVRGDEPQARRQARTQKHCSPRAWG